MNHVEIDIPDGRAPAYERRCGEANPAWATLLLDPGDPARLWIFHHYAGDGVPERIYYGRVPTWGINPYADRTALLGAIEAAREPLGLLAGNPEDNDTSEAAHDAVEKALVDAGVSNEESTYSDGGLVAVWRCGDWLTSSGDNNLSDLWPSDANLADTVSALQHEADGEGIYLDEVDGTIEDELLRMIREYAEAGGDVPDGSEWAKHIESEE